VAAFWEHVYINIISKFYRGSEMDEAKYQVFISSTYLDLADERKQITEQIIACGYYPIGMEYFNLGNENIWEHIKRLIEGSDFYVVLVGGRYGSTDNNGKSYTHKEYEYAKSLGKPVKVFMLSNSAFEALPSTKLDPESVNRNNLIGFRNELMSKGVEFWSKKADYQKAISKLEAWIRQNQRHAEGWVRGHILSENQILRYLFNSSNSLKNLAIDDEFIATLPRRVHDIADVVYCIDGIRERYLMSRLPRNMSVFVSYKLPTPTKAYDEFGNEFSAHYRNGLASNKEGLWQEGRFVSLGSNIHRAYTSGQTKVIHDTNSPAVKIDQRTKGERGYCCIPVFFGNEVVAVLGVSSQFPDEIQGFTRYAEDAAIAFASVLVAYAGNISEVEITADKIRAELDEHFAATLSSNSPQSSSP